ncbi:hypothetical protein BCM0060_p2172 (plasmid) [Bacillus cereus]|nr:hypothetical protein BCM0060_p2172 [Bacillus cereus]BCD08938.1 hypothetical protein BC30052_p2220 [Bacillus cereus]
MVPIKKTDSQIILYYILREWLIYLYFKLIKCNSEHSGTYGDFFVFPHLFTNKFNQGNGFLLKKKLGCLLAIYRAFVHQRIYVYYIAINRDSSMMSL